MEKEPSFFTLKRITLKGVSLISLAWGKGKRGQLKVGGKGRREICLLALSAHRYGKKNNLVNREESVLL